MLDPQIEGWGSIAINEESIENNEDGYNRKPSNVKKKKGGGFQSMGLSKDILFGVLKHGYTFPTPIQRKAIPVILSGKDVVAMARTGSGKTAAFLIPMFEKLRRHSAKVGARAVILSPTRELALQTMRFAKDLGKRSNLRCTLVLGGDSLDEQFAAFHENPDVIIATPGRLAHVMVEMNLKLTEIEYVVFDEADRLFEMGFAEQITNIMSRLSKERQTLLFSATLPKSLVEFARAKLSEPTLIRLDVDSKVPETLRTSFISCAPNQKTAVLIHFLQNIIKEKQFTVVFLPTKHHVEYVQRICEALLINTTYIYSSLDPTARKINTTKFRNGSASCLLVTDLAARGLDIPILNNVINYNFPAEPKLFVHRVGRVARVGRTGCAYSFVSSEETAYMLDLHLFLSRTIRYADKSSSEKDDGLFGKVPQDIVDANEETINRLHMEMVDVAGLHKSCENALKKYKSSLKPASGSSVRKMKEEAIDKQVFFHPLFGVAQMTCDQSTRIQMLQKLKEVRPKQTIFEVQNAGKNPSTKTPSLLAIEEKRAFDKTKVSAFYKRMEERNLKRKDKEQFVDEKPKKDSVCSEAEIEAVFPSVEEKKTQRQMERKEKQKHFFIPYNAEHNIAEDNYSISNSFNRNALAASIDLLQDEADVKRQGKVVWNKKTLKFQGQEPVKKIKTESGAWIKASYKTHQYARWKAKNNKLKDNEMEREDNKLIEESIKKKRRGGFQTLNKRAEKSKTHPLLADQKTNSKNKINSRKLKGQLKNREEIKRNTKKKKTVKWFNKLRKSAKRSKKGMALQISSKHGMRGEKKQSNKRNANKSRRKRK